MQIQEIAISDLRQDPENSRIHSKRNLESIKISLEKFGQQKPIVISEDNQVIAGNGTLEAARILGWEFINAVRTPLNDMKAAAYAVADNRTAELAAWDTDKLRDFFAPLKEKDFDLALATGFSESEINRLIGFDSKSDLTDPDAIPGSIGEAKTRVGDIWILGDHRLHCGDSSKPQDVDKLLAGARIHLITTDPPYNVNVEPRSNNAIVAGNSSFPLEQKKATTEKLRAKDRVLINDLHDEVEYELMLRQWFGNIARVLEPGRGFYIWGGYANCANYPAALKESELYFSQTIIWVKEHPVLGRKDFMGNHEWCFYGWRKGAAHQYYGPTNAPDVWELTRVKEGDGINFSNGVKLDFDGSVIELSPPSKKSTRKVEVAGDSIQLIKSVPQTDVWRVKKVNPQSIIHLTEKPVELAIRAIIYSSKPGENVLDLFGGSGSTLIGAERTGRRAYLMELDPHYCDVIIKRWEDFTGKKAVCG